MRDRRMRSLRWGLLLVLAGTLLAPGGAAGASLHPKLIAKVAYGTTPIGFARDGTHRAQ